MSEYKQLSTCQTNPQKFVDKELTSTQMFRSASDIAGLLMMYLKVNPALEPTGYCKIENETIMHQLNYTKKELRSAIDELVSLGFLVFSESEQAFFLKKHLKYQPVEDQEDAEYVMSMAKNVAPDSEFYGLMLQALIRNPVTYEFCRDDIHSLAAAA